MKFKKLFKLILKTKNRIYIPNTKLIQLKGHNDVIISLSFAPNNDYLATASLDSTANVYGINPLKPSIFGKEIFKFEEEKVKTVCFSPNSEYFATASWNINATIYGINSSDSLTFGKVIFKYTDHHHEIKSLCFSIDEEYFASGSIDKTTIIYGMNPNQEST